MNFKLLIMPFAFLFLISCGVKAKPLSPPSTAIKSYIDTYTLPAKDKIK